jgi:hypothetical protein
LQAIALPANNPATTNSLAQPVERKCSTAKSTASSVSNK